MDTVNILSSDLRNKIRKEVSFVSGAWVEFFDDITMDVVSKAQEASKESNNIETSLEIIVNQIADWNFADKDKNILPISVETLKKLPSKILFWFGETQKEILANINQTEDTKKKESLDS